MSDPSPERRRNRFATLERLPRPWGDAGPLVRLLCEHDAKRPARLRVRPTVNRERFKELAVQSQLLTPALLESAWQELLRDEPVEADNDDPTALAQRLVDKRLLTAWQAEKLLVGKYKGYILANYRIAEVLGSGSLSTVYRAEHQMMRRGVAIQILTDRFARHPATRDLFFQRARIAAGLDHRNLVHVFDMGEQRGIAYVVMEFVPGYDLERLMRRCGPLPLDMCAAIVLQVCRGMSIVHANGQTLAGLVPSDVVLDPNGVPHVLTLRLTATLAHHPSIRAALGERDVPRDFFTDTPELRDKSDQQRDRWAVGLILYHLLTAELPTAAQWSDRTELERAIAEGRPDDPQPLSAIAADLFANDADPQSLPATAKRLQSWLEANE